MSRATEEFVARLVEEIPALQPIRAKHPSRDRRFLRGVTLYAMKAASPHETQRLLEILEESLDAGDPNVVELVNIAFFDVLKKREPRGWHSNASGRYFKLRQGMRGRLSGMMFCRWFDRLDFKLIDWKTWLSRFPRLRFGRDRDGREEIRVWAAHCRPGRTELEGLVLRKRGGRFDGWHLPDAPWFTLALWHRRKRIRPHSHCAQLWNQLEAAGVFELPIHAGRVGLDGCSYVVECRRLGSYRVCHCDNPETDEVEPEARAFVVLLKLLRAETGFDARR